MCSLRSHARSRLRLFSDDYGLLFLRPQNMFIFIHIIAPLPCLGTGSQCGAFLNFDVVYTNAFLSLVSSGAVQSALPPGAYVPLNCRGPVMLAESWNGDGMPVAPNIADCLNQAAVYNWVYVGMSGCTGGHDLYNCRSCQGCTQTEVVDGRCLVDSRFAIQFANMSDPSYPCDPMGGMLFPSTNPAHAQIFYGNNPPPVLTAWVYLFMICACSRVQRLR